MEETFRTVWLSLTLIGILIAQVLIGMYIAIVIYERIFNKDDN